MGGVIIINERNGYVSFRILMLFCCFIYSCCAFEFKVGGRDGYWVSNPSESYNHWAQRMRFQVNDTLLFKYKEAGSDSVVEVNTLDDYEKCNSTNGHPVINSGYNSSSQVIFTFDRSGPFYFISANKTNCDKGQKLIIDVMAVRNNPHAPPSEPPAASGPSANSSTPPGNGRGGGGGGGGGNTPVPAAAPLAKPPAASGPSANSSTPPENGGGGGGGNTPVPAAAPPSETPAASGPSANSSTPPGNGGGGGGGNSPVPAAAPPSETPATSGPTTNSSTPPGNGGGTGNTPVPPSETPAASGPSANSSTRGRGSSTGNTPTDVAPPARSFAAASYAPSVVLVSAVSLLFSVGLCGWNIYYVF